MLLQSHLDEIHLLPALPKAWPTGSVTGLRARGGYVVDISWKDGKLLSATVKNVTGNGKVPVRSGDKLVNLTISQGGIKTLNSDLK